MHIPKAGPRVCALTALLVLALPALAVPAPAGRDTNQSATQASDRALRARVLHREPFKIVLTGDSTVATEGGWGPGFCQVLTANVTCVDVAKNGRSTKSYLDEGLWKAALAEDGQYYFLQFGHNDQKDDPARHTDAGTTYAANLRRFVADVRAIGAVPILVSPLSRRTYKDGVLADDGLAQYAEAARRVAAEEHIAFIDLFTQSQAYLRSRTQAEADTLDAASHPDAKAENAGPAKPDRTHLNDTGKVLFGRMVADSAARTEAELGANMRPLEAAQARVLLVGKDATAPFHTVQDAIDHAPASGATILIAPGTYREKVRIDKPNIHLVGVGTTPQQAVLSWNDSAKSAGGTGKSGTVSVDTDGFAAENLTIENTWELEHVRTEEGSQAVALLMSSDRAVLDHVRLLGAQDTLYANSRTCHEDLPKDGSAPPPGRGPCSASRQYFRDVYIEGHVDFIFGDAKAVFDHCELHPRQHATVMLTAQSRHFPEEDSGYYFLHSRVTGKNDGGSVVFGRPWRDYSTVWFYDTEVEPKMTADGWSDWNGRLKTSDYREYQSHGPGVNGGHRIVTTPPLSAAQQQALTPRELLKGTDAWDPVEAADQLRNLWRADVRPGNAVPKQGN